MSAVIFSSSPAAVLLSASSDINSAVSSCENPWTAGAAARLSFFFRVASLSVKDSERSPSLTSSLGLEVVEVGLVVEVAVVGWRGPNVRNCENVGLTGLVVSRVGGEVGRTNTWAGRELSEKPLFRGTPWGIILSGRALSSASMCFRGVDFFRGEFSQLGLFSFSFTVSSSSVSFSLETFCA